jgi:hypothetical protein
LSSDLNVDRKRLALSLLMGAVVSVIGLNTWFGTLFGGDSRLSWVKQHARGSMVNLAISFPLMAVSVFGLAWIVVMGFILKSTSKLNGVLHFGALVVVPTIATALTLDGTRVFVCASTPAFLALVLRGRMKPTDLLPDFIDRQRLLLLALLVPAVMVHFGEVRLPYQVLYGRL